MLVSEALLAPTVESKYGRLAPQENTVVWELLQKAMLRRNVNSADLKAVFTSFPEALGAVFLICVVRLENWWIFSGGQIQKRGGSGKL